jgi:hypothetical protein
MESDIIFGLAAPVWRDHPQGRSRRGARLRHRQALVSSFSLATHIDADDMPSAGDLNIWRSASGNLQPKFSDRVTRTVFGCSDA